MASPEKLGICRDRLVRHVSSHAHSVAPARPLQVTRDADDNKFLECADAARADYLVTGNQRHFPKFWKRTKVITSRDFISNRGAAPDTVSIEPDSAMLF